MKKRILSMALTFAMIFSLLPMTALAGSSDGDLADEAMIHGVIISDTENDFTVVQDSDAATFSTTMATVKTVPLDPRQAKAGAGTTSIKVATKTTPEPEMYIVNRKSEEATWTSIVENKGQQSYATAEDIADVLESEASQATESSLHARDIEDGDVLFVVTSNGTGVSKIYVVEFKVEGNSDTTLANTGNMIKGTAIANGTTLNSIDSSLAGDVDLSSAANYNVISMSQETALGNKETKFVPNDKFASAVVKQVELQNVAEQNVAEAFELSSAKELKNTEPLELDKQGNAWVAVKVTAENGTKAYYLFYVTATAATTGNGFSLSDPRVTVTIDNSSVVKRFSGNLEGSSDTAKPAILEVINLPKDTTINNLAVKFEVSADSKISVFYEINDAKGTVSSYYKKAYESSVAVNNQTVTIPGIDFRTNALFVKIGEGTSAKYYKFTVKKNAANSEAKLISGRVKGNTQDGATWVSVNDIPNGNGTFASPLVISAELPFGNYSAPEIDFTASAGATIQAVAKKHVMTIKESDFGSGANGLLSVNTNSDGTIKIDGGSMQFGTGADTPYVYILVTSEDQKTKNVYRMDVTVGEEGADAVIENLVAKSNGTVVKGQNVTGIIGDPSSDEKKPTALTVAIPEGTALDMLSLEATVSKGASVEYRDAAGNILANGKTLTGVKVGTTYSVKVISSKTNSSEKVNTAYYKVTVVWAEPLPTESGITVNPDSANKDRVELTDGTIIVDGEITAADLLGALKSDETITIKDASGKDVTGTGAVGTGYTVVSGNTTLTVIVKGDTTGDGEVDVTDIVAIMKQAAGQNNLNDIQTQAADLAAPAGVIDVTDVVAALKRA